MFLSSNEDYVVLSIVLLCVLSQSIFGVGVLLWGTPLLVMYGLSYAETLAILLPVSLVISIIQYIPNYRYVPTKVLITFTLLTLPTVLIGLIALVNFGFDVKPFLIGALLIGVSLRIFKVRSNPNKTRLQNAVLLPFIGFVHGISNLGGSLLVVWGALNTNNKDAFRTYVASTYFVLASVQLLALLVSVPDLEYSISYIIYSVPIYYLTTRVAFTRISEERYHSHITGLMLIVTGLLLLKYFNILS